MRISFFNKQFLIVAIIVPLLWAGVCACGSTAPAQQKPQKPQHITAPHTGEKPLAVSINKPRSVDKPETVENSSTIDKSPTPHDSTVIDNPSSITGPISSRPDEPSNSTENSEIKQSTSTNSAPKDNPADFDFNSWLAEHPDVNTFAFQYHVEYLADADNTYNAAAVEMKNGTVICVAIDTFVDNESSKTADSNPTPPWRCYFEEKWALADTLISKTGDFENPLQFETNAQSVWLTVSLTRDQTRLRKYYNCKTGQVLQQSKDSKLSNNKNRGKKLGFATPPWGASVKQLNKHRRSSKATPPTKRRTETAPSTNTALDKPPTWLILLQYNLNLKTRQLWHTDNGRLLTLDCEDRSMASSTLFFRAPIPDSNDKANMAWFVSDRLDYTKIERAKPTPQLMENSVSIFNQDFDTGSSFASDLLHFTVLQIVQDDEDDSYSLEIIASLPVGEIGFSRMPDAPSVVWRIFHQVFIQKKRCIKLNKHHGFTAQFSRRTGRFKNQKRLIIKPPNKNEDESTLSSKFYKISGQWRIEDDGFVKGACPK